MDRDECLTGDVVPERSLGFFGKYLTLWVALCIVAGTLIGRFLPVVPEVLGRFEYEHISIPIAILIWLMIYPMMLQVDFCRVRNVGRNPRGLIVTWVANWLVKPFTMFLISYFFLFIIFRSLIPEALATEYLAGAILLGAAPCTAMVFVWSYLSRGDATYTLMQVATNDLIILVAFVPIVSFLMGVSDITVPYGTLALSVILFVVIPLTAGYLSRTHLIRTRGVEWFERVFVAKFNNITIVALLLTLILIFAYQGATIIRNPLHILLIAVPFSIQTFFIFAITYTAARAWYVPYEIAAPGAMIGASNFFELAVAVAIALFGLESGATLATVVGVLIEVPIMLALVQIALRTRHWFTYQQA